MNYKIAIVEQCIMKRIKAKDIEVVIYEFVLEDNTFFYSKVIKDLIVANRLSDDIRDVENKVYTRDLFNSDN